MEKQGNLKKIPNRITIFRILIIVIFIPTLLHNTMISSYIALFLFLIAAVSDFIDGYIARKYNVISTFGKVMDPLADKIMSLSAILCFVQLNIIPAWMVIIIVGREFLVSGIRILAADEGKIIMASNWGKAKTVIEIIAIISILFLMCVNHTINYYHFSRQNLILEGEPLTEFLLLKVIPYILMFIVAGISLISGFEYFFKNKHLFEKGL
ncbi:MAG: CDP-diacylglycerol--glycerol-3-phosphate 3-phosphatidyltransferase [Candidatus Goldbacteria bacterium]|nr:CDP-diacylglycerol--glycerol-3-phosphate 3-phosphatidyltransferase [Candidatus Goldiibacteriota bacterium]